MAAVVAEEEQAPVMGEEAVMGEEEQTLSLVMEEREPARSEEAEAEEPYAEVTGERGVVEGVVVEEAPLTNETLRDWVKRWCGGEREGLPPISTWNTSKVTDMSFLFCVWQESWKNWPCMNYMEDNFNRMLPAASSSFNDDISAWNTSNVTNMSWMFYRASSFNQPLNDWRVDNVTDMQYMFAGASSFNHPLGKWRVDNVTNMSTMFAGASSFNQPLNNWRVENVTNMHAMFCYASAFNQPLNDWQVFNVTLFRNQSMDGMFYLASSFNHPTNVPDHFQFNPHFYMKRLFDSIPLGDWAYTENMYAGSAVDRSCCLVS